MKSTGNLIFLFIFYVFFGVYASDTSYGTIFDKEKHLEKIRDAIKKIPEPAISEIKNLFENLFRLNELSFTLYGDKPVSFCSLAIDASTYSTCNNICWYAERI